MPVVALSRLLEAVAKLIKHATAISTILARDIFQARQDLALANSKLLLENSSYELSGCGGVGGGMPRLIPKPYLTERSKQLRRLIMRLSSRDF